MAKNVYNAEKVHNFYELDGEKRSTMSVMSKSAQVFLIALLILQFLSSQEKLQYRNKNQSLHSGLF